MRANYHIFFNIFILFLCSISFIANLGVTNDISLATPFQLVVDYFLTLFSAFIIIKKSLGYSTFIQLRFYNFYLLSLTICLLLLYYIWTPFLSQNNYLFQGFDPQRYYNYAYELNKYGSSEFGLNYVGVVYIYMFAMKIFGTDPLVPLFINSLLILFSITFLSRLICIHYQNIKIKYFSWLLLFPEFLYFTIMPSREIICMFAAVIVVGYYIKIRQRYSLSNLLSILLALLLLSFVRLPFAFISLFAILLLSLKFNKKITNIIVISLCLLFVLGGNYLSNQFGSVTDSNSLEESIQSKINKNERTDYYTYSDNSIASALIPSNPVEFFCFGFIRSLCYLLPNPATINQMLNLPNAYFVGDYFFVNLSSLLLFFCVPFVFLLIKRRKEWKLLNPILVFLLCYLFIIGTINTTLIHVRYRIVYDLFLLILIPIVFESYDNSYLKNIFTKWVITSIFIFGIFIVFKSFL